MSWFKDGVFITDISGRSKSQTADQLGAKVRDYIAKHIGSDQHRVIERVFEQPHAHGVNIGFIQFYLRVIPGNFACCADHQSRGFPYNIRFFHYCDCFAAGSPGIFEGISYDIAAAGFGVYSKRHCHLTAGMGIEFFHIFVVLFKDLANFIGKREKLHSYIKVLGVLAENNDINALFVIEGVAGISLARAQIGAQIEFLPQTDNGGRIDMSFSFQGRNQFGFGFFFRF